MGFYLLFFSLFFSQKVEKIDLKKYWVAELSDSLAENSGLCFLNEKLFTINDGGNSSTIFEISKENGKILNQYLLPISNHDWEGITSDGENLYISDIGNNLGNRENLSIYKINYEKMISSPKSTDFINQKHIKYAEQKDFLPRNRKNNFDAESIFFADEKLHILTKEWISLKTNHYPFNFEKENEDLIFKKEFFALDFLATDAYFYKNHLYIVGYTKKMKAYLQIFQKGENGCFFCGKNKKYDLGKIYKISQIEGVAVNDLGIYLSGEAFDFIFKTKAKLYFIPHHDGFSTFD